MKHGAISKLKFKTLAARLQLPTWQVVGVLESLWIFAIHHARNGCLSQFQPADIAAWMDYGGDANSLFESLVDTRWLDRGADGEVVIHDWADHRPTWLKGIEARELSDDLVATECETKSVTKSPTKSVTKSGTKQVGLGNKKKNGVKFIKPTADEVDAYCRERDNGISGEEFCDHYDGNGWRCGKNHTPMRDWRASVRVWERKRKAERPAEPVSRVVTPEEFASMDVDLASGRGLV